MRVGFGDDSQVIRSSKIKKPVGGASCSYLASMLFLQCSPPSFRSSHFPSFTLIPPSLSGVHLHVCLVPVVIALLCQSVTKSKMFSGNGILSLSQSFTTFLFKSGILWHRILLTILGWSSDLHTSQQRWSFNFSSLFQFWLCCIGRSA